MSVRQHKGKPCWVCGQVTSGYGYKYCSQQCAEIGNKAKVKEWFKRQPKKVWSVRPFACGWCGAQYESKHDSKYCSVKCRGRAMRSRLRSKKGDVPKISRGCACCAGVFFSTRKASKFCSEKCQRKEFRKRHGASINKRRRDRFATDPQYRSKVNAKASAWVCRKLKTDPIMRIKFNLRRRIRDHLKAIGSHPQLIGCSSADLRAWMEGKFKNGMNWENYGTFWVVDHIQPLASFDLQNAEHAKTACHYTNLQPLTKKDNAEKSDKITVPQMSLRV
jgi:predicted nucleic acid-binding Zn ribbon protein